jgi:mannose-1-phosphate guanylyltransferase/mannose-6-phosphate isomerase
VKQRHLRAARANVLNELERLAPAVLRGNLRAHKATEDLGFLRLDRTAFATAPNISIDYAVMEKTDAAAAAARRRLERRGVLVVLVGNHATMRPAMRLRRPLLLDTTDCYVHSERSLVSLVGVKNLIVVDTPDALLVAEKDRAQDVSNLVAMLKQSNRKEHEQHLRNSRPWGYFETLSVGDRFQVKLLHVNPGAKLSMQMHHHRSEHWVVVRGTAKVTIGAAEKLVQENESVYITATHWHRLENPGKVRLR